MEPRFPLRIYGLKCQEKTGQEMSVRNSLSRFVVILGQCYRKESGGAEVTHIKSKRL